MKTLFVIGLGVSLLACDATNGNPSGSGGSGPSSGQGAANQGGNNQGGNNQGGNNQGGNGGSNQGGNNQGGNNQGGNGGNNQGGNGGNNQGGNGGNGGASCANVPAPMGALDCGGGSGSVSSGGDPACATSCIDQGDNAYEAFCQGNTCECHYYPASSGTSQGTSSATVGNSSSSGGSDDTLICTCNLAIQACTQGFQQCCPAPWQ